MNKVEIIVPLQIIELLENWPKINNSSPQIIELLENWPKINNRTSKKISFLCTKLADFNNRGGTINRVVRVLHAI